jgi:hypothetical protein
LDFPLHYSSIIPSSQSLQLRYRKPLLEHTESTITFAHSCKCGQNKSTPAFSSLGLPFAPFFFTLSYFAPI